MAEQHRFIDPNDLMFLPPRETFAKLSGFPRSRGKCPKDKGGRCRMIKPKNATEKSFANVSPSGRNRGFNARVSDVGMWWSAWMRNEMPLNLHSSGNPLALFNNRH